MRPSHNKTKQKKDENASKATATQQEIQTTILISLLHWQGTFMQKREEAEMSSGAHIHDSAFLNLSP